MTQVKVVAKVVKYAGKFIVKYGAKAWKQVLAYVKSHWPQVAKWIIEWGGF